tara:strand:+ start:1953 stop:3077 length:1125 start_codon:yes stop_codon:yes gene_type:complete
LIDIKKVVYFIGEIGIGGSEKQLALLLKHIDQKAYKAHVIVFNKSVYGDLKDSLISSGVSVHTIPNSIKSIPTRMIFLYYLLIKIKPHIIHSWSIHDNIYAGIVGRLLNISTIIGSVRGSLYGTGFIQSPLIIKLISLIWVHKIVVNALSIKNELIAINIPIKKILFLPNCVEIESGNYVKKVHPLSENGNEEIIICTIGNLRKNKNHLLFIDILDNVIKSVGNVSGWIVGQPVLDEPQIKDELKSRIEFLGHENRILLLGFQNDVIQLLRKSCIFVFTSFSEGTPNAILEAMALKVPVISSNVGGISKLITHGQNGFILDTDDRVGYEKTIISLLENEETRNRIADNAFSYVKKFHDSKINTLLLEEIYNPLL